MARATAPGKARDGAYAIRPYWGLKHPASGLLHLTGAIFAAATTLWTVLDPASSQSAWHVVSALIFGLSMFLLYSASSTYHLLHASEKRTKLLRQLDHSMIYVFIAGCYTPFCLVPFRGTFGLYLLALVWLLAGAGVAVKLFWLESSRWIRIGLYLLMGWMSVVIMPQLLAVLQGGGFTWLALGGAAYTIGAVVYALKKPDPLPEIFGFHEIWHLLVLAGSFSHFWMIKAYVLSHAV